jgi:transcriptional regulator with XRE-family HTH domain
MIDMSTSAKYQEASESTMTFAANVRRIMDQRGMNVTELGHMADVSRPALSNLLNGKGGNCTLATAERIAEALGVPLHRLLRRSAAA